MIKELIIHLGDTKTGSTSIQRALANKAYKAPGVSIAYPARLNHNGLAATLFKTRALAFQAARFEKLYQAFQKSNADYGIVSAEHFQMVDPAELHQAIETYWPDLADRLRLVAYVRPHCDKILSAFSERTKMSAKLKSLDDLFDAFRKSGGLDYAKRFGKWREVFGARFELRPFVRDRLYQGDVVHDFFKYLLGNQDFEILGTGAANTSLTVSQLALLRDVHEQLVDNRGKAQKTVVFNDARSDLGRILAEYMQSNGLGQDSGKLLMPVALVERCAKYYAQDAQALDDAFFDGSPMVDALAKNHLKATSTTQSLNAADYFHADVIRSVRVFTNVLADLLGENPNQFKQAIAKIQVNIKTRT